MKISEKSKLKRVPKRGIYAREELIQIIDNNIVCHVAFIQNNYPVVIPTMYGRDGDILYIHGAAVSRLLNELEKEIPMSLSIARVTGLVVTRAAFSHSMNYESVVIFGKGKLVDEINKKHALKVISDNMLKGRWEEVREPTDKELAITKVIAIEIEEISGKRRDEGANDIKEDIQNSDVWAGVIPISEEYGIPKPSEDLEKNIPLSDSIQKLYK